MEDLEVIVQRMIDAGEPEESIAAVIQEYQDQNNEDKYKSDVIEPRQDETFIEPTPVSKISSADIKAPVPQTDTVATTLEIPERDLEKEQSILNNYNAIEANIKFENPNATEEEVKKLTDIEQRIFMEDVPEFERQILLGQGSKERNDVINRRDIAIGQIEDNSLTLENLNKQKKESEANGVPYSREEEAQYVKEFNTILKATQDLYQDVIKDNALIEDKDEFLDDFERNYTDIFRLENIILSTGTDMAIGVLGTLDMLKDEEGKEKSYLPNLVEYRSELARIANEDLGKPILFEDMDKGDVDHWIRWGTDGLINFVPSGAAAFSGPAAMPLFFAMGYGGRLSEFEMATKTAEEVIPQLEEKLKTVTDTKLREEIEKEIEFHNNALSASDLTKFLTSTVFGAAEVATEWATTLQLVKGLKGINGSTAIQNFLNRTGKGGFGTAIGQTLKDPKSWVAFGKGVGSGPYEGLGEGTNQIIGNWADRVIAGQDVSLGDGVVEAAANGTLIGSGFTVGRSGIIGRAALLDVISSKQNKLEQRKILNQINDLTTTLNQTNDPKVRRELYTTIRNKIKDANLNQSYAASAFIKLDPKQQQEVFELDRKSYDVNQRWINIAQSNASESTKTQMREELLKQFNTFQGKKRNILDNSKSIKLKNLTLPEGLEQGDLVRNIKLYQTNLNAVNQNNKRTKFLNKQVSIQENEIEAITDFVLSKDETNLELQDGSVINQKDGIDIVTALTEGGNVEGFLNPNTKTSFTFADRSVASNPASPLHEYTHAMLGSQGFKKEQYDAIQNDFKDLLKQKLKSKEITQKQYDQINNRFKVYDGTAAQSEELLVITGDAINLDILSEDDLILWEKIAYNTKQYLGNLIGKDDAQNFGINTAQDAYSLIKSFSKGVLKDAPSKVIKATDPLEETQQKDIIYSKAADIDLLVGPKKEGQYTVTKAQWDGGKSEQVLADIFPSLQGLIKSKIPREKPPGFSQEDFVSGTIAELIPHIRNFNPEQNNSLSGWINSQLQNKIGNVFKKGEAATKDVFEADVTEARGVAVEDTPTPTQEKSIRSKLRRDLKIDKPLIDKVKQTVRKTFGTKLPEIESKEFKQALQKAYRTELKTPLAELLGTRENYKKFLEDNFESIYKALPQDILNKRFRQFAEDTGQREKTPEGKKIFKKRSIDKQEFVDYFLGPDVGTSTKGTRKDALAETLGEIMALDATMEVIKEPEVKVKREAITKLQDKKVTKTDEAKIGKQIDRDPGLKFSKSLRKIFNIPLEGKNKLNALLKVKGLEESLDLKTNILTKNGRKKIVDNFKYIMSFGPRDMWFGPTGKNKFTTSGADYGISVSKNPEGAKALQLLRDELNAIGKDPNFKFGKPIKGIKDYKVSSYKTLLGNPKNATVKNKRGDIKRFNNKVSKIHKAMWQRFNSAIKADIKNASKIATYLKLVSNHTGHWHKMGATIAGWSINPKGKNNTTYEYEHAMPATAAYLYLLDVAIDKGNFDASYNAVMDNYKLIALDALENDKLGKAGLSKGMPKGWFLGDNFWWQRYFNTEVAKIDGGISPSSIINLNGKTFAEEFKIDVAGQPTTTAIENSKIKASKFNNKSLPLVVRLKGDYTNQMVLDEMAELDKEQSEAQIKFSKSIDLNKDFNDIIENKTGIGAEKIYSDVKAQVVGANKGRFNFFVPPSAEDFVGLLYKTLGKGKLGDSQMAWYKKHLLDPFARAMDNISRDRIALMNDFKTLKKDLKIVPKNLKKKLPGEPFTQEQAVRTYIWNKQGMIPDGMSKKDIKELTDFVESKPDLVIFADQLIALQKGDSYPAPKFGWLAGNITTDLMDGINTIKRAKYLEQWQYNVDQIFTKPNLNKLEAAYGKDYRTALENILKRMRTGRNREFTSDSLTGRVTDWLTNSIGAIMFFNTRSAVLQTISAVNFINFKDNNIFAAGKAFANQPQFWKDFKTLFNSDFLVDRRNGLKLNVNEADIADMAKKGGVRGVISEMLRLGFLPTQIADSFAIASGGSTFYRNRVKKYTKEGMSKVEAEQKAFVDFREIAEESQQSSRPDRISAQQAGPLGRIILAFANTPMQYTRLIKKAASDLKNGRGDTMTNISKIFYYGFVQNLFFNAMQQALFAMGFGDEEEETEKREEKYANIINSMSDSILRGAGVGGAIFSVLKNTAIKLNREAQKKSPKFQDVLTKEIAQLSPPVSSKLSKLRAAGRAYSWNKKEIMEKGFSLDNPAYLAAGQVIAATTNVPLDRAFKKIDNIRKASSSDYEAWARIAMLAGWSDWELGVKKEKPKIKSVKKKKKKTKKKPKKRF